MTVAIAVCLEDGAVLVADGRQVHPMVPNGESVDDVNKIKHIGAGIGCIVFGITIASDKALRSIRSDVIDEAKSPVEILQEIERSVECGWTYLQNSLGPDVDRTHKSMRAGLLVGGYLPIQKQAGFIGGVLFRPDGHHAPTLETKPFKSVVLGGEENNSHEIFRQVFEQEIRNIVRAGRRTQDDSLKALLCAGIATIRKVEQHNPEVGGIIRYTILRRGLPCFEGISSG